MRNDSTRAKDLCGTQNRTNVMRIGYTVQQHNARRHWSLTQRDVLKTAPIQRFDF